MENLKLKGSRNIRDLGGIKVEEGIIKSQRFYRAGHLNKLSKKAIEGLNSLNIGLVIDLRTDKERAEKPDKIIEGAKYIGIPFFDEATGGITHESDQRIKVLERMPDMNELYRKMVSDKCINNIAKIMREIINADPNKAILFHCAEGKDRTGIIALLIYTMLGANEKQIFDDYLFTNTYSKNKARRMFWMARIVFFYDGKIAARLKDIFYCKKEFLESAIDAIINEWKSIMNFITDGLGITENEILSFKKAYIE